MSSVDPEAERAQQVIERLLVDPVFRGEFRRDPVGACVAAGLPGLAVELGGSGSSGLETLELRESRSSLAGVVMAAAVEGLSVAEAQAFVEHGAKGLRLGHGLKVPHGVKVPPAVGKVRGLEHHVVGRVGHEVKAAERVSGGGGHGSGSGASAAAGGAAPASAGGAAPAGAGGAAPAARLVLLRRRGWCCIGGWWRCGGWCCRDERGWCCAGGWCGGVACGVGVGGWWVGGWWWVGGGWWCGGGGWWWVGGCGGCACGVVGGGGGGGCGVGAGGGVGCGCGVAVAG